MIFQHTDYEVDNCGIEPMTKQSMNHVLPVLHMTDIAVHILMMYCVLLTSPMFSYPMIQIIVRFLSS